MDLEEALRTTGAVRAFTDEPVRRADLRRILDLARHAPSGANRQPWRVVVVEDPATREELVRLMASGQREYAALREAGHRPFGLTAGGRWPGPGDVDLAAARDRDDVPGWLRQAPVLLAVLVELRQLAAMDVELDRHGLVAGASIYPFCRDVLLAARLVGLGGVLTTFAVRREPEVLDLLGAPEGYALAAVLVLGHPAQRFTRLARRSVDEFATLDRFDGPPI